MGFYSEESLSTVYSHLGRLFTLVAEGQVRGSAINSNLGLAESRHPISPAMALWAKWLLHGC